MPEQAPRITRGGRDLSIAERVLIATAEAAKWTTQSVPYGAIVVCAWRAYPEQFGLPGHPEYPDSSDIHKRLYGPLKGGELVESLGNKTFRVTELGLTKARSIVAEVPGVISSRKMIVIHAQPGETTQSVMRTIINAAALDAQAVATRLLAATLYIRFRSEQHSTVGIETFQGEHPAVGKTPFSVLIPASIEELQEWIAGETPGVSRRLLVRDSVLFGARRVLAEAETTIPPVVYGIESFPSQMIDCLAIYDGPRIATVLKAIFARYNKDLPLELPRLRLEFVDDPHFTDA